MLMRSICFLMLFSLFQNAHAQDLCKEIKKDVSADKYQYDFFSPYSENNLPSIRIARTVNIDPEANYDNFFIIFRITTPDVASFYNKSADGSLVEKEEKTLTVEFDDKSVISTDTVQIAHDISDDKTDAIRSLFYPITDANLGAFTSKKIVKFSLGGYEKKFAADSAARIMQYIKCIQNSVPKQ